MGSLFLEARQRAWQQKTCCKQHKNRCEQHKNCCEQHKNCCEQHKKCCEQHIENLRGVTDIYFYSPQSNIQGLHTSKIKFNTLCPFQFIKSDVNKLKKDLFV